MLMVVGGYPSSAYQDVELIDLSGQDRTCTKPPDFLGSEYGSKGTYIGNGVIVCGGNLNSRCYYYVDNDWIFMGNTLLDRYGSASINLDESNWWLTGSNFASISNTTEQYNDDSRDFVRTEDLPEEMGFHNLVRLNSSHIFVVVNKNTGSLNKTYFYNQDLKTWTDGPQLLTARDKAQAGLVTYPNGTQAIVVAGGRREFTSEILVIGDTFFKPGPNVDEDFGFGISVQFRDSFIIVGGDDPNGLSDIYGYDTESEDFVRLPQNLETARNDCAAFMVPESFCA